MIPKIIPNTIPTLYFFRVSLINKLDTWHKQIRGNKWMFLFTIVTRIALAFGFIVAGLVKIVGERFANGLATEHPMGAYLEALHQTGYYYTFIGFAQTLAGLLLLIPRTATLGAILYFPIIINICVLSLAVRFDGSLITSPLMVLANVYLLCWDYHKIKYVLPFKTIIEPAKTPGWKQMSWKFPLSFAIACLALFFITVYTVTNIYHIKPYNNLNDCQKQCNQSDNSSACIDFCDCIHLQGNKLDACLTKFETDIRTP